MDNKIENNMNNLLNDAQSSYQELRKELNNKIQINGKTLNEWFREYHSLKIPEDVDIHTAKMLASKLMALEQKASQSLIASNARVSILEELENNTYQDAYSEIVHEKEKDGVKLPAASHIDTMSKIATKTIREQTLLSKLEKNFWKDIITHLKRMRRLLERIDLNNSLELKCMTNLPKSSELISSFQEEEGEEYGE